MRRRDVNVRTGPRHAMDFGHRPHYVAEMFDHVRHVNAYEPVVAKRPGIFVEIPNHLGRRIRRNVDAQRLRLALALPAADIEDRGIGGRPGHKSARRYTSTRNGLNFVPTSNVSMPSLRFNQFTTA